ncbi:CHAT domain-containing protein [Streptomyces sp. NPDC059168]|uniref:CHAT domain-containing protein n=1 Tax=Streptomyces sp. NPDC059168 TaxID=3346753 RepID=UPI003681CD8A
METHLTLCAHCGAREPPAVLAVRVAANTAAGMNDWLATNDVAEQLAVCRWVSVHDQKLAAVLAKHRSVRQALHHVMADTWEDPAREMQAALDTTEFVALWGRPHSLPAEFSRVLKRTLRAVPEPHAQSKIYAAVLSRLRPTFGGDAGLGLRRVGWIYLLTDAAKAAFRARYVGTSVALSDEAWRLIDELSPYHKNSAAAVGHIATVYAASVGHLKPRGADWPVLLDTAMERLTTVSDWISQNTESTAIASLVVRLGVAQAQIWYLRTDAGLTGWLTGASRRLELLDGAERAMWEHLPRDEVAFWTRDPVDLPENLKIAITRLYLEVIGAAALVDPDRSSTAAQTALRLGTRPHHRFGALLGIAQSEPNLARREAHYARLLRETRDDLYRRASPWQQNLMNVRACQACLELATTLDKVGRPTAAWFWRRERAAWSNRHGGGQAWPTDPLDPDVADTSLPLDIQDEEGHIRDEAAIGDEVAGVGGVNEIAGLLEAIAAEHAGALVQKVMKMIESRRDFEILQSAAAVLDDWRPDRRRPRSGRLESAHCHTAEDFRRSLLESADEIAAGYSTYLRPELLNKLAREAALKPAQRLTVAEEALAVSIEAARWTEATQALRVMVEIAVDASDGSAAANIVHHLCGLVKHAVTQARGTADLIDVARQMAAITTRVATFLAARGHPELAFHAAHAGLGLFAEDAQLVNEFELAERFHRRMKGANNQLFRAMQQRLNAVVSTPRVTEPTAYQPETLLAYMPGPAAYIQLFGDRHGGFWAAGSVAAVESRRWWVAKLDVTDTFLDELREAVWHSLQLGSRRICTLRRLHSEIVGRFEDELNDVRDVVFIPHRPFSGIPLHAARSAASFLIERYRVTYLSVLADPTRPVMVPKSALVGGWDSSILAREEVLELKKHLAELGFDVLRPRTADLGRCHFLNPRGRWDIAHIAAHGDYQEWPSSMASELRLSRKVRLTAGDWLRNGCRASFAFINACDVGHAFPHAGDVNGFPLALRVRGTGAAVSALCPVDGTTAGPFAHTFYQRWPGATSLEAYQAACCDAITRGDPPAVWAPYVHIGIPITLAAEPSRQ